MLVPDAAVRLNGHQLQDVLADASLQLVAHDIVVFDVLRHLLDVRLLDVLDLNRRPEWHIGRRSAEAHTPCNEVVERVLATAA
eukprot:354545-Chlamydomonas_euryale.AAC.7